MACKKGAQKGRQRKAFNMGCAQKRGGSEKTQQDASRKWWQRKADSSRRTKGGGRKKPQRPAQKPAGDQKG